MTWEGVVAALPLVSAMVTSVSVAIAAAAFTKTLVEYRRQIVISRFDKFQLLSTRFNGDSFRSLKDALDNDDPCLVQVPFRTKYEFLGLFEEISLCVSSGIIRVSVAHYMFSYYAIACLDSKYFWMGENAPMKDDYYWSLFIDFANRMKRVEAKLRSSTRRRRIRF